MLTPYRDVLRTPGSRGFVVVGWIASLPMAMLGLGEVLLLKATTGSYTVAGAVSAVSAAANALASPTVGRQFDRRGQARVLPVLALVHLVAQITMITLAERHAPHWTLFVASAIGGAFFPTVGFLVRSRWSHVLADEPDQLRLAFALMSTLDELCFITGPPLVTVLATGIDPAAGLGTAAVITGVAGTAFAFMRSTQPPHSGVTGRGQGSVLRYRGMITLVLVMLCITSAFATIDLSTVAFAGEHGGRGYAGPVLATFALASGISGLASGVIKWRLDESERLWRGAGLFMLATLGLPFVEHVWQLMLVAFVTGFTIAPTLTCGFGLTERLMPPDQQSEAFALLGTAIGMGVASGTAAGGRLVDVIGPSHTYFLAVGLAASTATVALAGRHRLRSAGTPTPDAAQPAAATAP